MTTFAKWLETKAVRNPENYCPICGAKVHRGSCKPSILRAIDAANTRATNGYESGNDPSELHAKTYGDRLDRGFKIHQSTNKD